MDQRVFDEAVTETMDLLDMTYSEALKDTIGQFQQMVRSGDGNQRRRKGRIEGAAAQGPTSGG